MFLKQCLSNSETNSETTLSSFWNVNFEKADVYKQFLNNVAENTKIVKGEMFIPTNSVICLI